MAHSNGSLPSSPDPLETTLKSIPVPKHNDTKRPLTPPSQSIRPKTKGNRQDIACSKSALHNNCASPVKLSTNLKSPISPWRIHITVQAEAEDRKGNNNSHCMMESSSNRYYYPIGRKTTTKVPLKDADDSSLGSPRKKRGRPRKSQEKPVVRKGTPARKAENDLYFPSISPRKPTSIEALSRESSPGRISGTSNRSIGHRSGKPNLASIAKSSSTVDKGNKSATSNVGFASSADSMRDCSKIAGDTLGLFEMENCQVRDSIRPVKRKHSSLNFPYDPHKGDRVALPYSGVESWTRSYAGDHSRYSDIHSNSPGKEHFNPKAAISKDDEVMSPRESPDSTQQVTKPSEQKPQHHLNAQLLSFNNEGVKESEFMDEDEQSISIRESEGFSMVSVSSLPFVQASSGNSAKPNHLMVQEGNGEGSVAKANISVSTTQPPVKNSSSLNSQEVFQDKRSFIRASPSPLNSTSNVYRTSNSAVNGETPDVVSYPLLYSPPLQPNLSRNSHQSPDKLKNSTPRLNRVVRAGIALQGVLSSNKANATPQGNKIREPHSHSTTSNTSLSPKARLDKLFSGFGASTRRELRAGLRLGEELAKRRRGNEQRPLPEVEKEDDVFAENKLNKTKPSHHEDHIEYKLRMPNAKHKVLYPLLSNNQLPSPRSSGTDSEEDQTKRKINSAAKQADLELSAKSLPENGTSHWGHTPDIDHTLIEREREYQLEREGVIKQVQMANSSQVIIIDSDNESGNKDEGEAEETDEFDIWQAAMSTPDTKPDFSSLRSDVIHHKQDTKPRRGQIPSPWRKHDPANSATEMMHRDPNLSWKSGHEPRAEDQELSSPQEFGKSGRTAISAKLENRRRDEAGTSIETARSGSEIAMDPERAHQMSASDFSRSDTNSLNSVETGSSKQPAVGPFDDEKHKMDRAVTNYKSASKYSLPTKAKLHAKSGKTNEAVESTSSQGLHNLASTSWISYLTKFVPFWSDSVSDPSPYPRPLLPNGRRRLPRVKSEGPLCLHTPWTDDHYRALYVHYAAAKEGRAQFRFNPKSPSSRYLHMLCINRKWEKAVTEEDLAIVDAFLADLQQRGYPAPKKGEELIGESMVTQIVFELWKVGVMNGECEVGIGKIGLCDDSEEMWRPEMEPWFRRL